MHNSVEVASELLIHSFNKMLSIEKYALKQGPLKELTIKELHAIEAIGQHSKIMTQVARQLNITVGSLTVTMNRLVKKEYVKRESLDSDRRCVVLVLTPKGRLALRLHLAFHATMVKTVMEGFSEEEKEALINSLRGLNTFFKTEYGLLD